MGSTGPVEADDSPPPFRGNQPKSTRDLARWQEGAEFGQPVEPGMPIVDAHHHLFGKPADRLFYQLDDLRRDIDSGPAIIGTVYIEAYESGWRKTGPEALRPVGEVEWIAGLTREPLATAHGPCQVAAGIVCHADLALGDAVLDVLHAHQAVSDGRLRGLRQRSATVEGEVSRGTPNERRPFLLLDPEFRRGFRHLDALGLPFDAWVYHTQLDELIDLVDAFPHTTVIVDHMAGPIGVAEFRARRAEVLALWAKGMRALAERPNVVVKIGGMGMPLFGHGFEHRERPPTAEILAQAWRPYIETCLEVFGSARCMLESNFPVDKQSCTYADLWAAFKIATRGWSDGERADLFYRTACRTYRLPALETRGNDLMRSAPPSAGADGGSSG